MTEANTRLTGSLDRNGNKYLYFCTKLQPALISDYCCCRFCVFQTDELEGLIRFLKVKNVIKDGQRMDANFCSTLTEVLHSLEPVTYSPGTLYEEAANTVQQLLNPIGYLRDLMPKAIVEDLVAFPYDVTLPVQKGIFDGTGLFYEIGEWLCFPSHEDCFLLCSDSPHLVSAL